MARRVKTWTVRLMKMGDEIEFHGRNPSDVEALAKEIIGAQLDNVERLLSDSVEDGYYVKVDEDD